MHNGHQDVDSHRNKQQMVCDVYLSFPSFFESPSFSSVIKVLMAPDA